MEAPAPDARVFTVATDDIGRRLDRVLRKLLKSASLDRIYGALRKGEITVDGRVRPASYRLGPSETIELRGHLAAAAAGPAVRPPTHPKTAGARPVVLYRCPHFVVFDKPRGLPVHGDDSLATAAQDILERHTQPSLSFRPGPVHRLDRDTTGIVLFALTLTGAQTLSALLRDRACEKTYLALFRDEIPGPVTWSDTITRDREAGRTVRDPEGDQAITHVSPLACARSHTLAAVRIETGRTHQIRAQAALHGHPLAGDARYDGGKDPVGYVLHSARFRLPPGTSLSQTTEFHAPLPLLSREIVARRLGTEPLETGLAAFGEATP